MAADTKSKVLDHFGDKFRTLRLDAGISQEQIAENLDISVNTVSRIENGQTSADLVTVFRFAKMMNISIDKLFPKETSDEIAYDDPLLLEMVCLYSQLNKANKKTAYKTMQAMFNSLIENQLAG